VRAEPRGWCFRNSACDLEQMNRRRHMSRLQPEFDAERPSKKVKKASLENKAEIKPAGRGLVGLL
jgi:hypothetical protein